jgi:hypothetical protein
MPVLVFAPQASRCGPRRAANSRTSGLVDSLRATTLGGTRKMKPGESRKTHPRFVVRELSPQPEP